MWCWKELRKPYKLVWNGHPKPNGITVMLFLFTIPCTTAHLMKCALTNMRLIRSKPSTQICATTWNDWRVNPDVSQEEYNRWLRTCNSLSIVITTDNWPSAASQNMLRTWSTSFVLYLRHSHISIFKTPEQPKNPGEWTDLHREITERVGGRYNWIHPYAIFSRLYSLWADF